MKAGDLVVFDADIIKKIFPIGLFDGDLGTITSECTKAAFGSPGSGSFPFTSEARVWWVLWWTGDHAGKTIYCEEQFLRLVGSSASVSCR
jgi:hypothetical protein